MNLLSSWVIRCPLLLAAAVCSGFILTTSKSEQCGDLTSQEDSPIIIRNIGVKMCHLKCVETGGSVTDYDIDTLTCRLRVGKSNGRQTKNGSKTPLTNPSHVPPSPCHGTPCSLGAKCLESRAGKAVCVKAGTTFHPLKSQRRRDKKRRSRENLFHQACRVGNLSLVKDIFSEGQVFFNRIDRENRSASVMLALREGHIEAFDLLVNKRCDVSILDTHGNNILHMSCYGGQVAIVKHVLKFSFNNVDADGQNGRECSMTAAYGGESERIDFLSKAGRNVSMVHQEGDNVLYIACTGGQLEMFEYVASGSLADVNSWSPSRKNVLMFLSLAGYRNIFVLHVCSGCDFSAVDREGNNILHLAVRGEDLGMVKHVISQNLTDINSRGSNGWTPVMLAAMLGQIQIFDFIVSKGGDVSVIDDNGRNILHLASHEGDMTMVKHILSREIVDINAKTKAGETAAEIAEDQAYSELSSFLKSQVRQGE